MNWDAIGAIGEIVNAAAVVMTLAYLAVQVRYARDEARRSMREARADSTREVVLACWRLGNHQPRQQSVARAVAGDEGRYGVVQGVAQMWTYHESS